MAATPADAVLPCAAMEKRGADAAEGLGSPLPPTHAEGLEAPPPACCAEVGAQGTGTGRTDDPAASSRSSVSRAALPPLLLPPVPPEQAAPPLPAPPLPAPPPATCGAALARLLLWPCLAAPQPLPLPPPKQPRSHPQQPAPPPPQHTPCLVWGTSARRAQALARGQPHVFSSELSLYERAPRPARDFPAEMSAYSDASPASAASAAVPAAAAAAAAQVAPSVFHFSWPGGFALRAVSPHALPAEGLGVPHPPPPPPQQQQQALPQRKHLPLAPKASFFALPKE